MLCIPSYVVYAGDVNVSNDLRQLSLGQVMELEYSHYDINGYCFRTAKLEASRPLAATTNSGLVTSGEDATSHIIDYYDILQNIVEYTFGGAKELMVVFFQCDWFDPINGTRVDEFGMVEVKHELRYLGRNLLLAHQAQQVYYLSYHHPSFKNWWVVYKVHPEMHTHRYDEYVEGHADDLQRNAFENQSVFLKDKKDMNDLMHMSRKQISMLMTFDM
jgi:hypothetical protein